MRRRWRAKDGQAAVLDALSAVIRLVFIVLVMHVVIAVMVMFKPCVQTDVQIGCQLEPKQPHDADQRRREAAFGQAHGRHRLKLNGRGPVCNRRTSGRTSASKPTSAAIVLSCFSRNATHRTTCYREDRGKLSKKRKRRRFTSAQKASILSEHLFDKKSISEVCEAHELQPSVLYEWQRQAQANQAQALESKRDDGSARERAVADKLAVLGKKDGVLAVLGWSRRRSRRFRTIMSAIRSMGIGG